MADSPAARTRKPPPPFRMVVVVRTEQLSPRMMRVVLGGTALDQLNFPDPASSVRLVVPWPGDEFEIPEWTGNEFLLADGRRPALRTFTPVRLDTERHELTLDIVRHPGGAISDWAESAHLGDEAAISGPGRGEEIDESASRYVLLGDETAIPAIRELLGVIPSTTDVVAIIELTNANAELELPRPEAVTWKIAAPDAKPGASLLATLRTIELGDDDRVWAAGEAAGVQAIRKHLFNERGIPRHHATIRGYWKVPRTAA